MSALAALIIAPLAASASAILACIFIAWRNTRDDVGPPDLETQADAMVAVLCEVAQQGQDRPGRRTGPGPRPPVGLIPARRDRRIAGPGPISAATGRGPSCPE
ncbi:MAG: hypothetical protein PGN33_19150 [Methylobacterium radiotolerans]